MQTPATRVPLENQARKDTRGRANKQLLIQV
jgi:hypothetical protein